MLTEFQINANPESLRRLLGLRFLNHLAASMSWDRLLAVEITSVKTNFGCPDNPGDPSTQSSCPFFPNFFGSSKSYLDTFAWVTCIRDGKKWLSFSCQGLVEVVVVTKLYSHSWSRALRWRWGLFFVLTKPPAFKPMKVRTGTKLHSWVMSFHLALHSGSWTEDGSAMTAVTEEWSLGLRL